MHWISNIWFCSIAYKETGTRIVLYNLKHEMVDKKRVFELDIESDAKDVQVDKHFR